ncbi:TraC family protein, partial [Enterobacter hormaechei]|uniref:TraC family protein n=3 Tax=Enterobacter TaxID=547 RepID=UPI00307615B6
MSNPLDSVTRTVNSLLTALKMPDASSEANDVLGQMRFPQFSRLLPYRDYDAETGLFMNEKTMGFMLEAQPINGANETIVSSLENLMRTKLPREVPVAIHLVSSHLVGQDIEYGLRELSWTGEKADTFNAITRAYYLRAAEEGFPLPDHLNLPLTLRNYRVYISCSVPRKRGSKASVMEMEN